MGRRADLCPYPDFIGPDEADAGKSEVLLVCTGSVLGFLGIYEPFQEFAGAGASVPLLGFGNVLWKGVKEAIHAEGFYGTFLGDFRLRQQEQRLR